MWAAVCTVHVPPPDVMLQHPFEQYSYLDPQGVAVLPAALRGAVLCVGTTCSTGYTTIHWLEEVLLPAAPVSAVCHAVRQRERADVYN